MQSRTSNLTLRSIIIYQQVWQEIFVIQFFSASGPRCYMVLVKPGPGSDDVVWSPWFATWNDLGPMAFSLRASVSSAVVQSSSCVHLFETPRTIACQASLSFTISQSLPKFMSIVLVMPSSHLILWPSPRLCLQSFPASGTFSMSRLFASDNLIYLRFSFSISPSSEYSGLISLKIDCFDLPAVQGTFRGLF